MLAMALPLISSTPLRLPPLINRRTRSAFLRNKPFVYRPIRATDEEGPLLEELDVTSTGGLGGTSEEVFGPLAVMLIGYNAEEFRQFQSLLHELEAEAVALIPCRKEMMDMTLGDAIESDQREYAPARLGIRRTVILSGMYASEVQEVISAYRDMKFAQAVFAAYIPKNKDKRIIDLVDEVYDDHEYMIRERNRTNKQQ